MEKDSETGKLVPHELNHSFLHRIVKGDEKWIRVPSTRPVRPQKGVIYYELLKPSEPVNT